MNADLECGAMAPEQVFEERLEAAGAADALLDFLDLAMSEFSPAVADRGIAAKAAEKEFDFIERKTHFGGEAD